MKTPKFNWIYVILFALILSISPKLSTAQTVEISPNLQNKKIIFGTKITATEVENAQEYMFHIYSQDSSFNKTITKKENYLTHVDYYAFPRFQFLNYRIKAFVNNSWTEYSQATSINILLDCAFDNTYMNQILTPAQTNLIENQINELKTATMQRNLSNLEEITIPIVFHVMVPYNQSEFEFLSPSKINQAVDILNQLYAGEFSDNLTDTKIRFCLASKYNDINEEVSLSVSYAGQTYHGITYHNINGTGINLPSNSNLPYISNSTNLPLSENLNEYYAVFPTNDFLNIFVFNELYDTNIFGFAWSAAFSNNNIDKGFVAIRKDVIGYNDVPSRELGFTLGHEIGHYFGLFHTWAAGAAPDGECDDDDGIDDTAPHKFPNFTCNENSNQCQGDAFNDPIHNIMNYTPDGCRNQFTEGQAIYMRTVIENVYGTLNNPLPYNQSEDISHCGPVPDIEDIAIIKPNTGGFCGGLNNITIFADDADSFILHIYENNQQVADIPDNNFVFNMEEDNWETSYNFNENSHYILVLEATINNVTQTINREYEIFECGEIDNTNAQWHFDHGVSLDFTNGYAQLSETEIDAEKCETSACDNNGNLLFYTNGKDIWDHNNNIINISINDIKEKGKGIIPLKLGETADYFNYALIYFNQLKTLSYLAITIDKSNYSISMVDSAQLISQANFSDLGISKPEMVSLTAVQKIKADEYQIISCIRDSSETNYYPVAIEISGSIPTSFNSNNFKKHPTGINLAAVSALDETVKASPDAKFIVFSNPGGETFLFNFNTETGKFIEINDCLFYGGIKNSITAFSPNSQFLYYYIIRNQEHTIFQVNLKDIDLCNNCILTSVPIYKQSILDFNYLRSTYFLQEGPDGKIYFSRCSEIDVNSKYLGVIAKPNNNAAATSEPNPCGVIDDYIHYTPISGLINKFYLPNFIDGKAEKCNLDFKLCSAQCKDTVQILNLSHGQPTDFTWEIYDNNNAPITTNGSSFLIPPDGYCNVILSREGCEPASKEFNTSSGSMSILGSNEICFGSSSTYSLNISPSQTVTWYVNGVEQSVNSPVFTLNTENYTIGIGDTLTITAQTHNNFGCYVKGKIQVLVVGFLHKVIISDYCNETSPGQIEVQIIDENQLPLNFSFDNNIYQLDTTVSFFDLPVGEYSYTIDDNGSCSNSGKFKIQNSFNVEYTYNRNQCSSYEVDFQPLDTPGNYIYNAYINGNLTELTPPFTIGPENDSINYPIQDLPYSNIIFATNTTTGCEVAFPIDIPAIPDVKLISSNVKPYYCKNSKGSVELFLIGDFYIDSITAANYDYTDTIIDNQNYDLNNGRLFTFNNLEPGEHTFYFNDSIECQTSFTFTIETSDIATVIPTITPGCSGTNSGTVSLTINFAETIAPSGQIEWSNGVNTDYTFIQNNTYETSLNNLSTGTYSYTITSNTEGCNLSGEVNIIDFPNPNVFAGEDISNCGDFKVNIGNAATEGTPPYTYSWSPEDYITSSTTVYNPYVYLDSFGTYTYTVTVTDSNSCTDSDDITINILETPDLILSASDELICLGDSVILTAEIIGGVTPVEITWEHDSSLHSNTVVVSPTESTTYTVHATGANECSQDRNININIEDIAIYSNVDYQYGNNYAAVVFSFFPDINNTNYSFTLVDENNNPYTNFNALPTGHTYTATLVSENGCEYTHVFELNFIESLSSSIIKVNPVTCVAIPNGSVDIQINGGVAPYQVSILEQGETFSINESGSHTLDLTGVSPTNQNITIQIIDANEYSETLLIPGIHYAWNSTNGITLTNSNIGNQETFTGKIIQLGNENDQSFNITHNITFKNCIIYTNTMGTDEEEQTVWTVKKPYDLILNNTSIESGCPNNMWQGIEAEGQHGAHTTDIQSLVILKNKSRISDAMCAIKSINGAIIRTENSHYTNNQYDLYFTCYCAKHSLTKIYNNLFLTSRPLNKAGLYPKAHVYMNWVKGIKFESNSFKNSFYFKEHQYVNHCGSGIYSDFSSYDVTPVLSVNYSIATSPNYFEGLFYGIRAKGRYDTPVRVHHSTFTNNFRGIYMIDNNSARVLFNRFETTTEKPMFQWHGYSLNGTPNLDESYAVYLNSCEDFILEENTAENGDAGVYVYNTGETAGMFYRNEFGKEPKNGENYNIKAATIAVGRNSNFDINTEDGDGRIGLQIRCNKFTATGKAISVVNGNMRKNQGTLNGENKALAGNQFSETLVNGMDFTTQFQNIFCFNFEHLNLGNYNYYQHDDSQSENNGYYRELSEYNSVFPQTETGKYFESQISCPSHYLSPFVDIDNVLSALCAIREDRNLYNNLLKKYRAIVDKGNTEYLKATAELMNNENYALAYKILQNEGYLTDTVLTAVLCNNIVPQSALVAILIENSPLPEKVLDLVNGIDLNEDLKNLLMIYQDGVNNRVKLEYEMWDVLQSIADNESKIINIAHNNDSVKVITDSVMQYLTPLARKDYKYSLKKYNLHVVKGDLRSAKAELVNLEKVSNQLNDSLFNEIKTFASVENIFLAYIENHDINVIESQKKYLENLAEKESDIYSAKAQNLLALIGDYPYYEYTPMPEEVVQSKQNKMAKNVKNLFTPEINLYPNPTNGKLQIEYSFAMLKTEGMEILMKTLGYTPEPSCEKGMVNIYSNGGQLLKTIPLYTIEGIKTIDISSYPAGIYIFEIQDCYKNSKALKIAKH